MSMRMRSMRKKAQKYARPASVATAALAGASTSCFVYTAQISHRPPPPSSRASVAAATTPTAANDMHTTVAAPDAGLSRTGATFIVAVCAGTVVGASATARSRKTQRRAVSPGKSSAKRTTMRGTTLEEPKTKAVTDDATAKADDTPKGTDLEADPAKGTPAKSPIRVAEDLDGWTMFGRFLSASWDSFMDVSLSQKSDKKKGFEYRKGIEGMSMGSMAYEMMTTDENSDEYKQLDKVYQAGWGLPFVNLTLRKITNNVRKGSQFVGLDFVFLTTMNLLQTLGVPGASIDGIPVQNKWMTIVAENTKAMSDKKSDEGGAQLKTMVQNIVMGRMEKVAGSPMPVFLEGYGENAGLYKIAIGPRSVVVASDPVVIKHILLGSQEKYTKGILSEVLEPIMGKGLIPADPITWKARRRAIVPGFHKKWLQGSTEQIVKCANVLCADLERALASSSGTGGTTLNMEEKFTSVSLDIIGKAVFDYDFGSVKRESPVVHAAYSVLREAERRAQSVFPYWNLPGAPNVFRDQKDHEENLTLLNAVLDELIRNEMEQIGKEKPDDGKQMSLLEFLVSTRGEDVTTRQLRDDLMTLLIAGHETTAALLTWSLHELMKPEQKHFLDRALDEIDTVVGDGAFTWEAFEKMPFLKWTLLETLRLYPQPPLLIRRCVDGDEVPTGPTCKGVGETVDFLPGQDIFISTWSLQRSKELWGKDAAQFNPLRWETPIEGKGGWGGFHPKKGGNYICEFDTDYAFLPFGAGARKCIGDQFALLEAEAVLVGLLQRFDFKASPQASKEGVGMTTGATIHTLGGLFCEVKKRDGARASRPESQPAMPTRPKYDKKSSLTVAQRIEPEAMVVPTAKELRMLFTEQAESISSMRQSSNIHAIEQAYEKCREVTRENSKTFFLGSQLLAPDEQRVVWAIYNWCRETDELVDGPEAVNTTMADLDKCEERLHRVFALEEVLEDGNNWEDLALADGIRKFSLIERPFQDMIGGMAMDLVKERYETFEELEVYCYRVAGTVGLMTMPVLGFDGLQNFTEELQENTIQAAMNLGLAFQLTNVLRDIGEDARRGRIYMPLEDLRKFGITEDDIMEAANTEGLLFHEDRWRDFMEFQMKRCDKFYDEAKEGIVGLSEVNRLGVMAALLVYGEILDEIRKNNYDNFSKRAYVTFFQKVVLMGEAWVKCQKLQEKAEENIRTGKIFARRKEEEAALH